MTHLEMTHEAHQPIRPPTHTLLDAIAKARQLAGERDEPMIVYWDDDYNTYSWLPEHDYHHDPDYQHIEEQDVHWHSNDGYYVLTPTEALAAATTATIVNQCPHIIANDQAEPDDEPDDPTLEDFTMQRWADVDNWTF